MRGERWPCQSQRGEGGIRWARAGSALDARHVAGTFRTTWFSHPAPPSDPAASVPAGGLLSVRTRGLAGALLLAPALLVAQQPPPSDLASLDLEELAKIKVTSASRKPESLGTVAASLYVLTRDDIRRSAATSLPELLRLVPISEIEQAVHEAPDRVRVSEKVRLFRGAERRAVEIRDRYCTYPGCHVPAEACEVDHIVAYAEGGPTTQENGRLRCEHHHPGRRRSQPWLDEPPDDTEEDDTS